MVAEAVDNMAALSSLQSDDYDVSSIGAGSLPSPLSNTEDGLMDATTLEPQESPRNEQTGHVANYRNSFSADSPYFTAFCDTEMKSLNILGDCLSEISERAKTFVRTGEIMSTASRRLAHSCYLRGNIHMSDAGFDDEAKEQEEINTKLRKEAVGEDMCKLLELLGGVLEEVAAAQLNMVRSLEGTLGVTLEAFANREINTAAFLKQQADDGTETAEQLYSKYLTSRQHSFDTTGGSAGGSNDGAPPVKERGGFGSAIKNWGKRSLANEIDNVRRGIGRSGSIGGMPIRTGGSDELALLRATTAANVRSTLEQIRLAQASSELKRFRMMEHLVSVKHRRNFELGENIMASMHGMNAYFQECSDLVGGVMPKLHRIQASQTDKREKFGKEIEPAWLEREQALTNAAKKIKKCYDEALRTAELVAEGDPTVIDKQILNVEDIEEKVGFWQLPRMLADRSHIQRGCIPGVLMEGWLYKKSSAMIALQPWSRRWFIMDKDAIFYFRTDAENRKAERSNSKYPYSDRIKVCDVVLCTVRELSSDAAGNRFCFQLVTPSEKPLTLQAPGPIEYRTWVDGIRANTEKQLVHGDPHSEDLNKNIGKIKKKDRGQQTGVNKGGIVRSTSTEFVDSFSSNISDEVYNSGGDAKDGLELSPGGSIPRNPLVREILEANHVCADCGAPDPDWTSLNLGVLVCLECSAVHRSLGVHVSKVRSLMLDSLAESEIRLLLALGNDRVNPVWEEGLSLQKGWKKPTASVDRKTREEWIRSKYMWKGFLDYKDAEGLSEDERQEKYSRDLFEAAKEGNLSGAMYALAHGGKVDWASKEDGGKTPLHACALVKKQDSEQWMALETAEFLIQNGSKLNILDDTSHGVLDCALFGGAELDMVEFLTSRTN